MKWLSDLLDRLRPPGAARDKVAIEIDLEAGVLNECPVCRTIFDLNNDGQLPTADLLAHQRFDHRDPSVAVFAGDRGDLLRRLRSVRDRFDYHCNCLKAG
ncbi:MAG: hypothetical protein H6953_07220 [Chromatiaceae bacterium]|nr:hypothetical protein [Gammaproteobacteria bacterium]MCP5305221.1 hypothetical protein [Chromatiaceae bacterium]MCP5315180.1 hypothetical protein [Chromatiaceae bacterium]